MTVVVRTIALDASSWRTLDDLYNALFEATGATLSHARNANAFSEALIYAGDIELDPPYVIDIRNTRNLLPDAREELGHLREAFRRYRADYREKFGHEADINFLADP